MSAAKPRMISRNRNTVRLAWENANNCYHLLQIKNDLKQWQTIYYGQKNTFTVKGLAPCSWYVMQIRKEQDLDWIEFKIATTDGPYLIRHLKRAINQGNTALIRKIAHAQPYLLNTENDEMETALFQIVGKGDLSLAALAITLGANVNHSLMFNRRTPLMHAIHLGCLHLAAFFVDKGAKIDMVDCNGCNILHYAVLGNKIESVKFVLSLGVDVNSVDGKQMSALVKAVILGCDKEIVDFLLANGANTELKDVNGFDYFKHLSLL